MVPEGGTGLVATREGAAAAVEMRAGFTGGSRGQNQQVSIPYAAPPAMSEVRLSPTRSTCSRAGSPVRRNASSKNPGVRLGDADLVGDDHVVKAVADARGAEAPALDVGDAVGGEQEPVRDREPPHHLFRPREQVRLAAELAEVGLAHELRVDGGNPPGQQLLEPRHSQARGGDGAALERPPEPGADRSELRPRLGVTGHPEPAEGRSSAPRSARSKSKRVL